MTKEYVVIVKVCITAKDKEEAVNKAWEHLCIVDKMDVSFYTHEKGNTPEDQLEKLEIAYRKWGMSQKDETTNPDKTYEDFMETCEKVFTH